jgi:hypothetical protein
LSFSWACRGRENTANIVNVNQTRMTDLLGRVVGEESALSVAASHKSKRNRWCFDSAFPLGSGAPILYFFQ